MAFPAYRSFKSASATSGVNLSLPSGSAADDILLLAIEGAGEDGNADAAPTGGDWTLIGTVANGTTGAPAYTRLTLYWHRYDGTTSPNLTVPDAGDHTLAAVIAYSGAKTDGNPFEAHEFDSLSSLSTSHSQSSIDSITDDSLIIWVIACGDSVFTSAWANSSLASVARRFQENTYRGNDGHISVYDGQLATAGDTGTFSTTGTPPETRASCLLALAPAPPPPTVALAGSASGSGSSSGSLRVKRRFSGAANAISSSTAHLTIRVRLSGVLSGSAVVSGAISKRVRLSGSIVATSSASGSLSSSKGLSGVLSGSAVVSGAISKRVRLSGSIVATSSASGSLSSSKGLSGVLSGSAVVSGAISKRVRLSGSIVATSSASGSLVTESLGLVGTASGSATVQGSLTVRRRLSGALPGSAIVAHAPSSSLSSALTFSSPSRPRPVDRPKAYTAVTWPGDALNTAGLLDAFSYRPHLYVDSLNWVTAPMMSTAELSWRYGKVIRAGSLTSETVLPLPGPSPLAAMERQWIRIDAGLPAVAQVNSANNLIEIIDALGLPSDVSLPQAQDALRENLGITAADNLESALAAAKIPLRWWGTLELVADRQDGVTEDGVAFGKQSFLAYGLEMLLEQTPVRESYWQYESPGGSEYYDSESAAVINGPRQFMAPDYRDIGGGIPEPFRRYLDPDSGGVPWSTRKAVEMLVRSTNPLADNQFGFTIEDSDLELLDDTDQPQIDTNASLHRLLNALIPRQRLLNWWVEVETNPLVDAFAKAKIRISTSTESDLLLPTGHTISANGTQYEIDYKSSSGTMSVHQLDTTAVYDRVRCLGGNRRHVRSDRLGADTPFSPAWNAAEKSGYESGAASLNEWPANTEVKDQRELAADYRAREEFDHVFSQFRITAQLTQPQYDLPSSEVQVGIAPTFRMLNELPLFRGSNYSVDPPTHAMAETSNTKPEFMPVFAVARIPSSATKYSFTDRLGVGIFPWEDADDKREFSLRASVRPGYAQEIWLKAYGAPQHVIAHGDFTPQNFDQDIYGHWDWRDVEVTWAYEEDRRCEGVWPDVDTVIPTEYLRELVIEFGDAYRLDWIARDTLVALNGDREPVRVSQGGWVRDDRETLVSYAKLALQHYSKPRSSVRLDTTFDWPAGKISLGDMITQLRGAGAVVSLVNAPITGLSIHYPAYEVLDDASGDLPAPKLSIETAYGQLDLLTL